MGYSRFSSGLKFLEPSSLCNHIKWGFFSLAPIQSPVTYINAEFGIFHLVNILACYLLVYLLSVAPAPIERGIS